jgi:hypothetical protein
MQMLFRFSPIHVSSIRKATAVAEVFGFDEGRLSESPRFVEKSM